MITEWQNKLSWKGPTRIIKPCTAPSPKTHAMCLRVLSKRFLSSVRPQQKILIKSSDPWLILFHLKNLHTNFFYRYYESIWQQWCSLNVTLNSPLFLTANQPRVYLGFFPLACTFVDWCQWASGLIKVWQPASCTEGPSSHSAKYLLWDTPTLPRHIPNTSSQGSSFLWSSCASTLQKSHLP